MLDETISVYLGALRTREAAKARFAELTRAVTEASQSLAEAGKALTPGNPRTFHPQFGSNGGIVDGHTWPTAEAINAAWRELQTAVARAEDAWRAIHPEARVGLLPPTT